jgi:hypothetical protein
LEEANIAPDTPAEKTWFLLEAHRRAMEEADEDAELQDEGMWSD